MRNFSCCLVLVLLLAGQTQGADNCGEGYEFNSSTCDCYFNDTEFYPKELFTECQIRDGAVILHLLGMFYMFTALALICDEFFVPALEVIIEVLDISDDVAGATFMAAGGSAPEFFTSIIGVFISKSQVGVGTIIGSAVFNVLFVIGMCAVFSKELLTLTWWPLFRDVTFYSTGLTILIISFSDQKIFWYEALCLFIWYLCYCLFMKINEPCEKWITKNIVSRLPCNSGKDKPQEHNIDNSLKVVFDEKNAAKTCECQKATNSAAVSVDKNGDTETAANGKDDVEVLIPCNNPDCLNSKVTQFATMALCANTLDPVGNANKEHSRNIPESSKDIADDQATFSDRMKEIGRLQTIKPNARNSRSFSKASIATLREHRFSRSALHINLPPVNNAGSASGNNLNTLVEEPEEKAEDKQEEEEDEEKEEPLDLSWPDSCRARLFYIILAPILFPLAFSTPDVRRKKWRMFFPITFIMSIIWIAVFSFLMVWWTETFGRAIGLGDKPEIMGLTLIAAGTSVPDLITSVIVARKGLGDMAVSSSLGSNLFDICVGLPIPWMLAFATNQVSDENGNKQNFIDVNADGMFCSVVMLYAMLIAIIFIIGASSWRMTKLLGFSMFFSYFIYLTLALLMGLDKIPCLFDDLMANDT